MKLTKATVALLGAAWALHAFSQEKNLVRHITLPAPGKTSNVKDVVSVDRARDYVFTAPTRREVHITLTSDQPSAHFNVMRDKVDEPIFESAIEGPFFKGALSEPGAFRVRVYVMPDAARRPVTAKYTLTLHRP